MEGGLKDNCLDQFLVTLDDRLGHLQEVRERLALRISYRDMGRWVSGVDPDTKALEPLHEEIKASCCVVRMLTGL